MQLVRDEDQRQPLTCHFFQCRKQVFGFLRGQNGGRLVEDQNVGVVIKRFQDFHALLLAHREIAKPCIGINLQAKASGDVGNLGARGSMCRFKFPEAFSAGDDIFKAL